MIIDPPAVTCEIGFLAGGMASVEMDGLRGPNESPLERRVTAGLPRYAFGQRGAPRCAIGCTCAAKDQLIEDQLHIAGLLACHRRVRAPYPRARRQALPAARRSSHHADYEPGRQARQSLVGD